MKKFHVKALKNVGGSRRFSIRMGNSGAAFDLDETNPEARGFPDKTMFLSDEQVTSLQQSGRFDIRPAAEDKPAAKPIATTVAKEPTNG